MFRFKRELILPLFFERRITVAELARRASVSHISAWKAINGENVGARVAGKIAAALEIDAAKFLARPTTPIIF